ncbi:MAG: acetate/propionate family kinase [Candidatus Glassbacteria bacterium]|nr:acetate/propionate family kinase [Candidatus Glassbacteria bacterium]
MNVLVFILKMHSLRYSMVSPGSGTVRFSGSLDSYRDRASVLEMLAKLKERVSGSSGPAGEQDPPVLAFRLPYGGDLFRGPELVGPGSLARLQELIPQAPLHLPAVLSLIECAGEVFDGCPGVLVSETAFFLDLPARERLVALDFDLVRKMGIRHYGFNGTLHQAACAQVRQERRRAGLGSCPKIVSICLESRPEVAAVIGHRPVMVTSGTTPLEGFPGSTTCGELDPGIVITLAQELGWGPEQINQMLTSQSGLKGLTGENTDLGAVFSLDRENYLPAREVVRYRLLTSCGAAKAAMGGLDAIVFSGQYAGLGETLGPQLTANPALAGQGGAKTTWELFLKPRERVIAEIAAAATPAACPAA